MQYKLTSETKSQVMEAVNSVIFGICHGVVNIYIFREISIDY